MQNFDLLTKNTPEHSIDSRPVPWNFGGGRKNGSREKKFLGNGWNFTEVVAEFKKIFYNQSSAKRSHPPNVFFCFAKSQPQPQQLERQHSIDDRRNLIEFR